MSQTCAWRRTLIIPEEVKTIPCNATQTLRINPKIQASDNWKHTLSKE